MRSKRAELLAEVLKYVNAQDWSREDGFLVFGMDGYFKELLGDEALTHDSQEAFRRFANAVKTTQGKKALMSRVSLQSPPSNALADIAIEYFKSLAEDERDELLEYVATSNESPTKLNPEELLDQLDAAIAEQAIQDMQAMFDKATLLDQIDFEPESFHTSAYFAEAHSCYLHGQKIASALICRAVVEDALKKTFDKNGEIRQETRRDESYYEALLNKALKLGVLDQSRVDMARQIRRAGNSAAHDLGCFKAKYEALVPNLIDHMRSFMEDLSSGIRSHSRS